MITFALLPLLLLVVLPFLLPASRRGSSLPLLHVVLLCPGCLQREHTITCKEKSHKKKWVEKYRDRDKDRDKDRDRDRDRNRDRDRQRQIQRQRAGRRSGHAHIPLCDAACRMLLLPPAPSRLSRVLRKPSPAQSPSLGPGRRSLERGDASVHGPVRA